MSRRMSASSSTIKMSRAMSLEQPCARICLDGLYRRRRPIHEDQPDRGPPARSVVQYQIAAVLLHDFFNDGEAEPGALDPRCDIGLGQAVALDLREAAAIVLDQDRGDAPLDGEADPDLARRAAGRIGEPSLDRIGRILQQIAETTA